MHPEPEQDKEMDSFQLGDCIGQVVDGYPLTGSRWEKHAYTGALSEGPEFVNTDPSQPSKAAAAIAQIAPDRIACRDTPFTRVWQGIMPHPIIPYDPDERKKKFAHAFEALAEYIEVWQTPNLPGSPRRPPPPPPRPRQMTPALPTILRHVFPPSPNGAPVNSQGCQPLGTDHHATRAPTGRQPIARGANPWGPTVTQQEPQRGASQ